MAPLELLPREPFYVDAIFLPRAMVHIVTALSRAPAPTFLRVQTAVAVRVKKR